MTLTTCTESKVKTDCKGKAHNLLELPVNLPNLIHLQTISDQSLFKGMAWLVQLCHVAIVICWKFFRRTHTTKAGKEEAGKLAMTSDRFLKTHSMSRSGM